MIQKIILLWVIIFLGSAAPCFSQGYPEGKKDEIEIEKDKIREKIREMEETTLQRLKKMDPAAYQERMKIKELSIKINKVVSSFREGKVTEEDARRKLVPLIKQSLERRFKNLDSEIEAVNKRIEYLKKIKRNPDILVNQEIDRYLGKGSRIPAEEIPYRL